MKQLALWAIGFCLMQQLLCQDNVVKKALIIGVTGQDGYYLTDLLLKKGYEVHGIKRRSSSFNTQRIDQLFKDSHQFPQSRFHLHYGDITDASNIFQLMAKIRPDEVYNLAAQSHVAVSFELPTYTAQVDALGTLNVLEAIRVLGLADSIRFYQASTSELYGLVQEIPQNEKTPFYPRSPYAVAKTYGFWITVNYREAYNIFACNGILFNHESPVRGETFVTRKITRAVARIAAGFQDALYLGNLDAKRDWGHAREYVEAMWLMLQQESPDDFVIATGQTHTVREFVERAFAFVGIELEWHGYGVNQQGKDKRSGITYVYVDPQYFRPTEVDLLIGDASKAEKKLGWKPKITFNELVDDMMRYEMQTVKQAAIVMHW